jgi:DNA-binding NtrC family response regulator
MTELLSLQLERLLIGQSPAMLRLRADVARFGALRLPILIQGPTGSGKELVARGLHLASGRTGSLVAFNVCAVPETMFEDTLFGHVKGAFTGANSDSPGYLAEANGGSVMLDEINGLSLGAQAKLLRAIETGEFRPVGARRDRRSDFRLIAASNANLMDAVNAGTFRADLFFRMSGVTIHVPMLQQRMEDIPHLIEHFLGTDGNGARPVLPAALEELYQHTWPGNVRELRYVVARASSLAGRLPIDDQSVRMAIDSSSFSDRYRASRVQDGRTELVALLTLFRWNTLQVAERLGVHRATVYRRMQRYGLAEGPD